MFALVGHLMCVVMQHIRWIFLQRICQTRCQPSAHRDTKFVWAEPEPVRSTCSRSLTGWTIYKEWCWPGWFYNWSSVVPQLSCCLPPTRSPVRSLINSLVKVANWSLLDLHMKKISFSRSCPLLSVSLCPGIPNKMSRKAQFHDGIMQQIEQNWESRRSINRIIGNIKISRSLCF